MNSLIEKNVISEMDCGSNFAYILNDNNIFLSTEYKVLQNQANSCFVKCMKMLYNGKIQLFYHTKSLKPFSTMISSLDPDNLLTIVANVFNDIIDVRHNGFLSCQNIDVSFERIYVDPATYKVSLVYIPISKRIFDDKSSFENEIRTSFVKLISGVSSLSSPKTMQLCADLSNGSLSLEDLFSHIKGTGSLVDNAPLPSDNSGRVDLRLVSMNAPSRIEIIVNKDEFIIGKKAELCDGVIDFNKMISRSHCKIIKSGGQFTITDLQSANGTFVNKVRLQPNHPEVIRNGDIVRLANSDFQVSIK